MEFEIEISCMNSEAIDLFDKKLDEINGIQFDKIEQDGFDGMDLLIYFIITGSASIAMKEIGRIITAMIKRDDVKSFKCKGMECKGYSEKEVEELIDKMASRNN